MTEAIVQKLNLKTRLGYGIGDIAICLYWSGVGLYLLYFYTDVVGISPSLAGLIYGLGMFWDAITDPFMGYMAERTRTKWGCLLYTSPSPRDTIRSRMPSSA